MTAATGSGCGNFPEGWVRQCLVNRPASPHHIQRDPSSQQQCPRLRIESNLSGMVLVVASLTFTQQPRCSGVDSLSEFPPSFVVGISFSSILLGCQPLLDKSTEGARQKGGFHDEVQVMQSGGEKGEKGKGGEQNKSHSPPNSLACLESHQHITQNIKHAHAEKGIKEKPLSTTLRTPAVTAPPLQVFNNPDARKVNIL